MEGPELVVLFLAVGRCCRRSCAEDWGQEQRRARKVGRQGGRGREAGERTWSGSDLEVGCEQRKQEQGWFEAVARMNGGCRPETLLLSFDVRSGRNAWW